MKNYVQQGDVLTLTAPYTVTSGAGALVGGIFGVATGDVANAAEGEFVIRGVYDIAKASGAVAVGDELYWDNTAKVVTTVPTGNTPIGFATQAQLTGDATARVRLASRGKLTLSGTATLNFGSIGAGLAADLTISVPGAAVGDPVAISAPAALESGITVMGFVSATDTVTVRAVNNTAGAVDPASAAYRAIVFKL